MFSCSSLTTSNVAALPFLIGCVSAFTFFPIAFCLRAVERSSCAIDLLRREAPRQGSDAGIGCMGGLEVLVLFSRPVTSDGEPVRTSWPFGDRESGVRTRGTVKQHYKHSREHACGFGSFAGGLGRMDCLRHL